MALSKSYLSVNGELCAEWTEEAKTEVGYIRDALGNVMETVNTDGTTLNTFNYKPFGDVLSKTGSAPDPKYLWCGTWGYRASSNKWVFHYVRACHYSFADAAWTTIDPLWPAEMAYGYVENRVMTGLDYWGMQVAGDDSFRQWGNRVFPPNGDWGAPIVRGGPVWKPGIGGQSGRAQGGTRPGLVGGGIDPVNDWAYGDYCGKNNWKRGCGRPVPKDCVDMACQKHDDCLETSSYASFGGSICHCNFLSEVMRCLDIGGCINSKFGVAGKLECYEAAAHIISVFSFICPGTQFTVLVGLGSRKGGSSSICAPSSKPFGGFENPNTIPGAIIPKPGGGVIRV